MLNNLQLSQFGDVLGYRATVLRVSLQRHLEDTWSIDWRGRRRERAQELRIQGGYLVAEVSVANLEDRVRSYDASQWKLVLPTGQIDAAWGTRGPRHLWFPSGHLAPGGGFAGTLVWSLHHQRGNFVIAFDPLSDRENYASWPVVLE